MLETAAVLIFGDQRVTRVGISSFIIPPFSAQQPLYRPFSCPVRRRLWVSDGADMSRVEFTGPFDQVTQLV